MNFVEAVKELKEGRCEGIRRSCWDNSLKTTKSADLIYANLDEILAEDWELVNPVKQYETKKITRYLIVGKDFEQISTIKPEPCIYPIVELTGFQEVEVKPKKKIRREITRDFSQNPFIQFDAKIYAEWEE